MIIADMQYEKQISKFIRNLRESKKISLNSFAYKNFIDSSTLSRIETGLLELKISNLEKIANGLDLKPSELLKIFEDEINYKL